VRIATSEPLQDLQTLTGIPPGPIDRFHLPVELGEVCACRGLLCYRCKVPSRRGCCLHSEYSIESSVCKDSITCPSPYVILACSYLFVFACTCLVNYLLPPRLQIYLRRTPVSVLAFSYIKGFEGTSALDKYLEDNVKDINSYSVPGLVKHCATRQGRDVAENHFIGQKQHTNEWS